MIVLVPPGSAVRQIAHETEAELHLLAVEPRVRRRRIAHTLVRAAIALAAEKRYAGLVLSTQESMTAAHAVYAGAGFERTPARDWNRAGRVFYAYQLAGMAKAAH